MYTYAIYTIIYMKQMQAHHNAICDKRQKILLTTKNIKPYTKQCTRVEQETIDKNVLQYKAVWTWILIKKTYNNCEYIYTQTHDETLWTLQQQQHKHKHHISYYTNTNLLRYYNEKEATDRKHSLFLYLCLSITFSLCIILSTYHTREQKNRKKNY